MPNPIAAGESGRSAPLLLLPHTHGNLGSETIGQFRDNINQWTNTARKSTQNLSLLVTRAKRWNNSPESMDYGRFDPPSEIAAICVVLNSFNIKIPRYTPAVIGKGGGGTGQNSNKCRQGKSRSCLYLALLTAGQRERCKKARYRSKQGPLFQFRKKWMRQRPALTKASFA